MPSSLRTSVTHRRIAPALGMIVWGVLVPSALAAQQPSARTSVAITVRVQPTLVIHGVVAGATRLDRERAAATSVVDVESNLRYRLRVRLASSSPAQRTSVRAASGSFEPLVPGVPVDVIVSRAAGRRAHEVLCRVDASTGGASDVAPCALVYELTAEHHDSLLRATAFGVPTPRPPVAGVVALADAASGR